MIVFNQRNEKYSSLIHRKNSNSIKIAHKEEILITYNHLTVNDLLQQADAGGYAIPAFNYSDLWEMEAIVSAAQELRSPVMIATNAQVVQAHGIEYLAKQGRAVSEQADVPVINHLDHCFDEEICMAAIEAGYPSVMIDKSHCCLEENIAVSKRIVARARGTGVGVEAEIGRIKGKSVEGFYTGDDFLVDVASAVRLVSETNVTSLAVGIGNAHGFYKEKPEINFRRLQEVNEAIDTPLVLHGGTGIPVEDVQKAIRLGINKVNVGTQLHYRYVATLRKVLAEKEDCFNVIEVMTPVLNAVREDVKKSIFMCMSDHKV